MGAERLNSQSPIAEGGGQTANSQAVGGAKRLEIRRLARSAALEAVRPALVTEQAG